jgi:DNA mismatch endonuclease, patch repair protein
MGSNGDSWATEDRVRSVMQGNRSRDTRPELAVRRAVHALGLRYRVARRPVPGLPRTADLVFPREQVAVMVDGCFWHGCPEHCVPSKSNQGYWDAKIASNQLRDADTNTRLTAVGWLVMRFWEHDDPYEAAELIRTTVLYRRQHTAARENG